MWKTFFTKIFSLVIFIVLINIYKFYSVLVLITFLKIISFTHIDLQKKKKSSNKKHLLQMSQNQKKIYNELIVIILKPLKSG